ncbi:MAG: hypothetical protein U1D67_07200 [Dehalococcoidia bacterium]|nr:hypothetical protein [Dehalococcoidia bacterium]MDZ4246888.1 hypothetical protein [Dehalococcoidia bacterium]
MKLAIKTNLGTGESSSESSVELDTVSPVIKDVLDIISEKFQNGRPLYDKSRNEVDAEEYSILLNGTNMRFLPEKLLTPLSEGDEVQVYRWFELLGGG